MPGLKNWEDRNRNGRADCPDHGDCYPECEKSPAKYVVREEHWQRPDDDKDNCQHHGRDDGEASGLFEEDVIMFNRVFIWDILSLSFVIIQLLEARLGGVEVKVIRFNQRPNCCEYTRTKESDEIAGQHWIIAPSRGQSDLSS